MPPVHALRLARVRAIYASCGLFLALAITPAFAATPTTTTLSISPSSNVALDTVVTLTAAVTNPGVVTTGTVNFCNVNATDCAPGSGLYGTAQLTSAGTASIKHVFGYGVNNIKAVFLPTTANASSTSLTETVSVAASQIYPSSTTLAASGSAGDYTLSGIVTAFGSELLSGSIHFLDTSNSNMQIGSTSLGLPVYGVSASITYPTGLSPDDVAVADFNGDGKLDLAVPTDPALNDCNIFSFLTSKHVWMQQTAGS